MSSLIERMQADLANVVSDLKTARESAEWHNNRVAELEREERGLQAALSIMEGRDLPAPVAEPALDRAAILAALTAMAPRAAEVSSLMAAPSEQGGAGPLGLKPKAEIKFETPEGWTEAELNGDKILLEPGMVVTKNSFGEDVIAATGTKFTPMEEPEAPAHRADLLPPIADYEKFDNSPEEMLDG